ncbi:MAG: YtxH domain-containing protein [Patescibacteria group bacterium]
MSKDKDDISKKVDRFIMGALLGGAIGSVLGMTLAPKKGKETRDILKEKGKKLFQKSKEIVKKTKNGIGGKGIAEEGKHLFKIVKDKIDSIKEQRELSRMTDDESRKIPHEE